MVNVKLTWRQKRLLDPRLRLLALNLDPLRVQLGVVVLCDLALFNTHENQERLETLLADQGNIHLPLHLPVVSDVVFLQLVRQGALSLCLQDLDVRSLRLVLEEHFAALLGLLTAVHVLVVFEALAETISNVLLLLEPLLELDLVPGLRLDAGLLADDQAAV